MPRIFAVGVAVVGLTVAGAAVAQTPPASASAPQAPETPNATSAGAPVEAAAAAAQPQATDAKAAGEAASPALAPQGYTYKTEGRRDPFVTLLKRGSDTAATTSAARTAGLAGLGAGEVTLRGILASQGGYVAMLLGSDEKTYIVRTGDKLADGTIRTITADAMVILQQVNDPLSQQKQREVRKVLRHIDGTY